jgi:acyl dehydratase
MFIRSVMGLKGLTNTLHYGADRIRYLSPVPAGSRLRGRVSIAEAEDVPPNGLRVHYRVTIEIRGRQAPGLRRRGDRTALQLTRTTAPQSMM